MSKNEKIYYEHFKDAVERNRKKIPAVHKRLKNAGVNMFYQVGLISMVFQKQNLYQ